MNNKPRQAGSQLQEFRTQDETAEHARALVNNVYRRDRIAGTAGFFAPVVLEIAHYFWLSPYISKNAIQAILIVAVGVVGCGLVYLIAHMMKAELRKYVPDATSKNTPATIETLLALDNPEAWRVFHSSCRWSSSMTFFIFLWLGACVVVFSEPWIYRLIN